MPGAELSAQPARAGRSATLLIAAYLVCLLLFIAGGAVIIWTFAQNGQTSVNCVGDFVDSCGTHHSYVLGGALLGAGFIGSLITVAIGARLAVGSGLGALAYVQRRRSWPTEMPPPTPPDWVGGQPPGTPGSPSGPPQ
jgi:hypothetical protein